ALVLKAGQEAPAFIPLFEEDELLALIQASEQSKSTAINELYAARGGRPKQTTAKGLLELNWKPLEAELAATQRIYFVPSGLLHRINLGAVALDNHQTLADRYELIQLGSSRQLVSRSSGSRLPTKALLMGGINYELKEVEEVDSNPDALKFEVADINLDHVDRSLLNGRWDFLEWTENEVQDIADVLRGTQVPVSVKTGDTATEDAFRLAGAHPPSPQILHLATHGFFFPDPEMHLKEIEADPQGKSTFHLSEHPMIRSGLVLAGANHVWTGNEALPNREDGILTAYEISQLDLSNTELVVLSACETGLGDIQGNEGVYGLQRAFKIAGARYLIMSLWQVPDKETQEFMTTFYREWLEQHRTIPEAFRQTQARMREKYKQPYAWAGF
ncbi:MAG: CHAT domain-containing protein, partial [Phaeodactylibacter sp.]|nr:CHAT domain-containing protein [Phaeodactylibacter sp.]